jgi:hypothetical protein
VAQCRRKAGRRAGTAADAGISAGAADPDAFGHRFVRHEDGCPKEEDRVNIRRYFSLGGILESDPPPDWANDIEDAKLLGVKPWEIDEVPIHWRRKARTFNLARQQAYEDIAKRSNASSVFVVNF